MYDIMDLEHRDFVKSVIILNDDIVVDDILVIPYDIILMGQEIFNYHCSHKGRLRSSYVSKIIYGNYFVSKNSITSVNEELIFDMSFYFNHIMKNNWNLHVLNT